MQERIQRRISFKSTTRAKVIQVPIQQYDHNHFRINLPESENQTFPSLELPFRFTFFVKVLYVAQKPAFRNKREK